MRSSEVNDRPNKDEVVNQPRKIIDRLMRDGPHRRRRCLNVEQLGEYGIAVQARMPQAFKNDGENRKKQRPKIPELMERITHARQRCTIRTLISRLQKTQLN